MASIEELVVVKLILYVLADEIGVCTLASYLEGKKTNKRLSQNEETCILVSITLSWDVKKKRF